MERVHPLPHARFLDAFVLQAPTRSDYGVAAASSSEPSRTSVDRFRRYNVGDIRIVADVTSYESLSDRLYRYLDSGRLVRPASSDHIQFQHYDQSANMMVHGESGVSHYLHSSLFAMVNASLQQLGVRERWFPSNLGVVDYDGPTGRRTDMMLLPSHGGGGPIVELKTPFWDSDKMRHIWNVAQAGHGRIQVVNGTVDVTDSGTNSVEQWMRHILIQIIGAMLNKNSTRALLSNLDGYMLFTLHRAPPDHAGPAHCRLSVSPPITRLNGYMWLDQHHDPGLSYFDHFGRPITALKPYPLLLALSLEALDPPDPPELLGPPPAAHDAQLRPLHRAAGQHTVQPGANVTQYGTYSVTVPIAYQGGPVPSAGWSSTGQHSSQYSQPYSLPPIVYAPPLPTASLGDIHQPHLSCPMTEHVLRPFWEPAASVKHMAGGLKVTTGSLGSRSSSDWTPILTPLDPQPVESLGQARFTLNISPSAWTRIRRPFNEAEAANVVVEWQTKAKGIAFHGPWIATPGSSLGQLVDRPCESPISKSFTSATVAAALDEEPATRCGSLLPSKSPALAYPCLYVGDYLGRGETWSTFALLPSTDSPVNTFGAICVDSKRSPLVVKLARSTGDRDIADYIENEIRILQRLAGHREKGGLDFVPRDKGLYGGVGPDGVGLWALVMEHAGTSSVEMNLRGVADVIKEEIISHYTVLQQHRVLHNDAHPRNWIYRDEPSLSIQNLNGARKNASQHARTRDSKTGKLSVSIIDYGRSRIIDPSDTRGMQLLVEQTQNVREALEHGDVEYLSAM